VERCGSLMGYGGSLLERCGSLMGYGGSLLERCGSLMGCCGLLSGFGGSLKAHLTLRFQVQGIPIVTTSYYKARGN
jgi:hypothetical protein